MLSKWVINRIGLLDFWYYDEEEFPFADGRLLLRGSNGSGKSVTMQSFIPLLLDGNKASERLDPFGTKARRLENYLLEENDEREERTGYLYMEFKRQDSETYLTLGLGMRARRNKKMDSWYFAVNDGRRIGKDLLLYRDAYHKVTLSKLELRNCLGDGGVLLESQRDYMNYVNDQLFGFETQEEYKELVDLLIQLRTPKLSKDFKPTVLNEILSSSLQSLSEEDLRPMSEAIENMDHLKSRLDSLKESKKAADRIAEAYHTYNQAVLYEKSSQYVDASNRFGQAEQRKNQNEQEQEQRRTALELAHSQEIAKEEEQTALLKKREDLNQNDAARIRERQLDLLKEIGDLKKEANDKQEQIDRKREQQMDLAHRLKDLEGQLNEKEEAVLEQLEEMDGILEHMSFDEHSFMKTEVQKRIRESYTYQTVRNQLLTMKSYLEDGIRILQKEQTKTQELSRVQTELEKNARLIHKAEVELEDIRRQMLLVKSEVTERIVQWNQNNHYLNMSPEKMRELVVLVEQFGLHSDYMDLTQIIWQEERNYMSQFQQERMEFQQELKRVQKERKQEQEMLQKWQKLKQAEPEREEAVVRNRERLRAANVVCKPFYQLVDFEENVPKETMDRLEAAMLRMGILDALVVPESERARVLLMDPGLCDSYLFTNAKEEGTRIAAYVHGDTESEPEALQAEIGRVLQEIKWQGCDTAKENESADKIPASDPIHFSGTFLSADGSFGIGMLRGSVSGQYEARFIGEKSQERYRLAMIEASRVRIQELLTEEANREESVKLALQKEVLLKEEADLFPSGDDIRTAVKMEADTAERLAQMQGQSAEWEGQARKLAEQVKELRLQAAEVSRRLYMNPELALYESAREEVLAYNSALYALENLHQSYRSSYDMMQVKEDQKEQLAEDMDDLLYDLQPVKRRLRAGQLEEENCASQLKLSNYEQIQEELDACEARLKAIPKELRQLYEQQTSWTKDLEQLFKEAQQLQSFAEQLKSMRTLTQEAFLDEWRLGYVAAYVEEQAAEPVRQAQNFTKHLVAERSKEDCMGLLQKKFYENLNDLVEYRLTLKEIFGREAYEERMQAVNLTSVVISFKRLDIAGYYQSREVPFGVLLQQLEKDIQIQENLVKDSDRELFEDILANTISKKIRNKIYKSEDWVRKMNQLMGSMNTSSGLTLNLVWKKKKAEQEEQLDTRELVELLKKDADLMTGQEFTRLSEHFHSKVEEARRQLSETGNVLSFHAIMREVLDYRKWFEFQLYFQKTGEARKELTNNAFFTFSGGEKAMSMYVPLFSAVVAKYQGARADAPRLVSLDEAFAGVDEMNIRDMFRLMVELDFQFIINSQILWGDYDSVPELAIYQLLRPENAKFVTVVPYLWNGKQRVIVEK